VTSAADTRPAETPEGARTQAPAAASAERPQRQPVRVLCIAGSPRRHGNSEQLLDELALGVTEAGGEAIRLRAVDAGITPCRGCNACSKDGVCVVSDGMDEVYPELDAADVIVVATPVFFATVPATLKALFDRCQPYWARRYVLGAPPAAVKRPGAILVVGGGGDPFGTTCAVTATRSVFAVLGVSAEEVLEVVGPDAASDIASRPEALTRARELGRELVDRPCIQG
jgi:multimeric flavodoxin WrbA